MFIELTRDDGETIAIEADEVYSIEPWDDRPGSCIVRYNRHDGCRCGVRGTVSELRKAVEAARGGSA